MINLNLLFDMCRWHVEDEDVEVVHRAIANHHPFFTSRPLRRLGALRLPALHKLVQLGVREGQVTSRGSSNLQRFEAHHPSALEGGGDPMVAGNCFRLVEKDTCASDKRKESQPSSSSRKKQKTYASHGSQGQDRGY